MRQLAQKKTTFKYHLKKTIYSVMVHDEKIGEVAEHRIGWACVDSGMSWPQNIHDDHKDRVEAADCVFDRYTVRVSN